MVETSQESRRVCGWRWRSQDGQEDREQQRPEDREQQRPGWLGGPGAGPGGPGGSGTGAFRRFKGKLLINTI